MSSPWYFFRTGGFSGINAPLLAALKKQFPEREVVEVDVVRDIVQASPKLHARAVYEAFLHYGFRILRTRIPPRDFFPRLPCVLKAITEWVEDRVDPMDTAFTFQTQSLFDTRRPGVPHFLYTDHTYLANRRYAGNQKQALPVPPEWREMERNLYRQAAGTFTSSDFAARSVVEDYEIQPSRVLGVHSGINTPLPATIDFSRRTGHRILFVAVEWERKGGPELYEAFSNLGSAFPNAELHIVGCKPPISHPRVFLHGRIPIAQVADHYAAADVFCLPSRVDPSASVLAEAAAFALPVVATLVGGNAERVIDGETGFLVPPNNSVPLTVTLRRLLADAELRSRLGRAGRALVEEKFTWDAVAQKMAVVIRSRLTLN